MLNSFGNLVIFHSFQSILNILPQARTVFDVDLIKELFFFIVKCYKDNINFFKESVLHPSMNKYDQLCNLCKQMH